MKHFKVVFCFLLGTYVSFAQQEFVVQSNHADYISLSEIDSKRNVLITYGYIDNTLKFWNADSGLLYKTIDTKGSMISNLEINQKEGKLYALSSNSITVYSTITFEKMKKYPLEKIYSISFVENEDQGSLTVFAQDQNYMTSFYTLDEKEGKFIPSTIPPLPVDVEVSDHYFTKNGKFLFITPVREALYVYNVSLNTYNELKGDYIALFENGDVLRSIYDYEKERLVYMRMHPETRKIIWTRTFENAVLEEGIFQPTHFDIGFSKDREAIWIKTLFTPLTKIDATTGEIIGAFPYSQSIGAVIDQGNFIYAQIGVNTQLGKFKLFSDQPMISFGYNLVDPAEVVAFQNNEVVEILFSAKYGQKTYSLFAHPQVTQFTNYTTNYRDDFSNGKLIADVASDKVFAITSTIDPIKIFNRGKPESFDNLIENYKNVQQFDFSSYTKQLVLLYNRGLRVLDTETKKETFFKPMDIDVSFFKGSCSLAPFNNSVAYISREIQADQIAHQKLYYFDFGSKTEKWSLEGNYFGVFHVKEGKQLLVCNATDNTIAYLDASTGALLQSFNFDFKKLQSDVFLSPQQDYLLISSFQTGTSVIHLPTQKIIQNFTIANYGNFNGSFVTNTIIAIPENGAIKFIDILTLKEVLRMYVFEDESWVAYTPQGQFDGSRKGWEKVAFIKDQKTIPLEQVFDAFYTPRLINQVLASKGFKSAINIASISSPPSVNLIYIQGTRNLYVEDDDVSEITVENNQGKIVIEATSKHEKIKEIRLYHNGKLLGNNTRNLFVEDDVTQNSNKKEIEVKLLEGINEFSAVAINSQGTESIPKKLLVKYNPPQKLIKPQGIQAHLLIIGIDEYQNAKYNLNYAVADASAFKESITKGLEPITSKTHIYFIKNSEAIKTTIELKLNEIAALANPQDIFIFYYAGHGVINQEGEKEFYIVPSDVTQLYGNDDALKQKGIAASQLKQIASGIAAQKQLYILDACQSAGALNAAATYRGAAEEKAIAQLARSTGTHWLTASGSQQFATEFDELGHGVFTYVLLEALSGKADSGDQRITVNELKAYLESRVPEISEKYKGSPQYPSSFGFGQDFPISINN